MKTNLLRQSRIANDYECHLRVFSSIHYLYAYYGVKHMGLIFDNSYDEEERRRRSLAEYWYTAKTYMSD